MSPCQAASEGAQVTVTKAGFGFELSKLLSAPEVTANKIVTFITIIRIDGVQRWLSSKSYSPPMGHAVVLQLCFMKLAARFCFQ